MKRLIWLVILLYSFVLYGQNAQKIIVDTSGSQTGYYLAIPPSSNILKGVLVVFCPFRNPESILPETRLHNVAAANDLLTVYASLGMHLLPDDSTMVVMDRFFAHIVSTYKIDSSLFAVGGFDNAGMSVLRYAELAREFPGRFHIRPSVVFGISSPVDLAGLYHLYERQIQKNFFPPAVGESRTILNLFDQSLGKISEHPDLYKAITPFDNSRVEAGPEKNLSLVALRLYYDADIEWQLRARRSGYYDTYLPDGAELINRLLLEGNNRAEFISSRVPGMRSNGDRRPISFSIVDETDCIQWILRSLHIFSPSNPMAFVAPYTFETPQGWNVERTSFPPRFAPEVGLKGIEEIRFMPGWGKQGSPDYWSLAYLFWLDAGQKIDEAVLQKNIKIYFDGLIVTGGGPVPHKIPADKMVPTVVHIQRIKPEPEDKETYSGTVDMLDYMAMKPIRLNFLGHVRNCNDVKHIPLFLEMSPKGLSDGIWVGLKRMKKEFTCGE